MTAVWAHRGASRAEPENTVAAFAAAVALGADGVELDVRGTADGAPAVVHDAALADGRPVSSVRAADLPPGVVLLDAALDACGDLVVNIEIKEPAELAEVVVAEVRNRAMAGRVVVSSFDLSIIDRVRALDDGVPTGWLLWPRTAADPVERLVAEAAAHGHRAVNPYDPMVTDAVVAAAHGAGLSVSVWTVDDPVRIAALAAMGVDAVITNVPDIALRALGR